MRRAGLVALLVTLWILAWGQLTLANLLSGVAVTVVLLLAFPPLRRPRARVHYDPVGLLRLGAYVTTQLVTSNILMARLIVRRNVIYRSGVLAHRLDAPSEVVVTVMSSIIALSPGTMTVDVAPDSSVIYVHFFDLRDVDTARASLVGLEERVRHAIATRPEDRETAPTEQPSGKESP
jgi:multicomponent Na+:H+ antiporter subunit E